MVNPRRAFGTVFIFIIGAALLFELVQAPRRRILFLPHAIIHRDSEPGFFWLFWGLLLLVFLLACVAAIYGVFHLSEGPPR